MQRPVISREEKAALRGLVASHMTAHRQQQREFRGLADTAIELGYDHTCGGELGMAHKTSSRVCGSDPAQSACACLFKLLEHLLDLSPCSRLVSDAELPRGSTVLLVDCKNTTVRLRAPTSRVQLQSCTDVIVVVEAPILTSMLEVWKCTRVELQVRAALGTVQIDACESISATYASRELFRALVFASSQELSLRCVTSMCVECAAREGQAIRDRIA